jgi:NAD(P)-dependent dehydrogenase (short-subunit alcohol dehydrogenase family)
VTGAASGVGRGSAQRFADEGATAVLADIQADSLKQAAEAIVASGGKAVAVTCDVAREADIDAVVQTAVRSFGRIDILANIAQGGIDDSTSLEATEAAQTTTAFATGPLASLLFMQKCLPHERAALRADHQHRLQFGPDRNARARLLQRGEGRDHGSDARRLPGMGQIRSPRTIWGPADAAAA